MAAGTAKRARDVIFCGLQGSGTEVAGGARLVREREFESTGRSDVIRDGRALQDCSISFPRPVAMNIVALAATSPMPDESRN